MVIKNFNINYLFDLKSEKLKCFLILRCKGVSYIATLLKTFGSGETRNLFRSLHRFVRYSFQKPIPKDLTLEVIFHFSHSDPSVSMVENFEIFLDSL